MCLCPSGSERCQNFWRENRRWFPPRWRNDSLSWKIRSSITSNSLLWSWPLHEDISHVSRCVWTSSGAFVVVWQVSESTKALRWIMDALKSQGYKSKLEPPLLSTQSVFKSALIRRMHPYGWSSLNSLSLMMFDSFTHRLLDMVLNPVYSCLYSAGKSCDRDDGDSSGQETDDESPHTYARQLQYPGSAVTRFPVPEEKVSWEVTHITFMHSSCEWTSMTFCLIFLYFVRHTFCSFRQTSRRTFLQFTVSRKASKIWFDFFFFFNKTWYCPVSSYLTCKHIF